MRRYLIGGQRSKNRAQAVGHEVGKQPHQRRRKTECDDDRSRDAQHPSLVYGVFQITHLTLPADAFCFAVPGTVCTLPRFRSVTWITSGAILGGVFRHRMCLNHRRILAARRRGALSREIIARRCGNAIVVETPDGCFGHAESAICQQGRRQQRGGDTDTSV
jgi:hypothetical protein